MQKQPAISTIIIAANVRLFMAPSSGRRLFRGDRGPADSFAVRAGDGKDEAAVLAVAQRIDNDGDLVAGIQTPRLPTLAHQFDRSTHLDAPLDGRGLRV